MNKKKRSQSANVGKEDDTALNSQVTKTITEKADYTEQVSRSFTYFYTLSVTNSIISTTKH